jgi:hypothetical protein
MLQSVGVDTSRATRRLRRKRQDRLVARKHERLQLLAVVSDSTPHLPRGIEAHPTGHSAQRRRLLHEEVLRGDEEAGVHRRLAEPLQPQQPRVRCRRRRGRRLSG